ncbi:MAG: phosphoenolpyruvate kinase [Flavobacteriales bacterium]|nr:MAG: phosphoenolpyruvate kinase [Flavobacteriales bacterium]
MKRTLPTGIEQQIMDDLTTANQAFNTIYPGESVARQPVHTVYGGAQLFKAETIQKMGKSALKAFETYATDFTVLAKAFELEVGQRLASQVYEKVKEKLETEAVEDFRIDFEDGYGNRPDDEEDTTAEFAAIQVAKAMEEGILSPFIGIRIKPFTEELKERGVRTLDIFLSTLLEKTDGKLPENFVVTLPKVQIPEQVSALVKLFHAIEDSANLSPNSLKMEIMVETPQSIIGPNGTNPLLEMIRAAEGRCTGAHFGTYDYTAGSNITARYQEMNHPVCDFAHFTMKAALAETGVFLSDGATNVMPVGPHRGDNLSEEQQKENTEVVHRAWKLQYSHICHSLYKGIYQGWDLHPAQVPVRYTAVYAFFLESYEQAATRLKNFVEKAAQATLVGDVFDDAATGQGLLNYFLKAMNCGAISEEQVLETGLTLEEIQSRSFVKILEGRSG